MSDQNTDVISRLGEILSIDREEVIKRLEELDVDATSEVLDAVNQDDAEKVAELMSGASNEETESTEEQDVDDLSPLFTKTPAQKRQDAEDDAAPEIAEADADYLPNMGQPVRVGKRGDDPRKWKDAVVKIVHAPNDTVGVMVDGELVMVKKNEVHPLKENVLGLTAMPAISRLQQLAGMTVGAEPAAPVQVQRIGTVANGGPQAQAVAVASSDHVDPALCQVMTCLDDVESALGDLKVKDAKNVRARLNAMVAKLNEAAPRPRKV